MSNPSTKAAAKSGRQKHREYDPGEGFDKEVKLDDKSRADAVKVVDNGDGTVDVHIKELKPNNARAKARGESQLKRYEEAARKKYENVRDVHTQVETYD